MAKKSLSSTFVKRIVFTVIYALILTVTVVLMLIDTFNPFLDGIPYIIVAIIAIIGFIGLMVEVNLWLDYLSFSFGHIYWPALLVIAIVTCGLSFLTPVINNTSFGQNFFYMIVMLHGIIAFCAVPMLEGHTSHYMVIEDTYIDDYLVDTNEYYADFYIPGWWKKLIVVGLFAGLYYGLSLVTGIYPWLQVAYSVIEVGFLGYLTIVAIVKRIRAS